MTGSHALAKARKQADRAAALDVFTVPRPDPPAELSAPEADEWRAIVTAMPATHFSRDTHPMLIGYVRKACRLREIRVLIDAVSAASPLDVERYLLLCKAENDCCRILATLATKMRIAQQAYQDSRSVGMKPDTVRRPWE